MLKDQVKNGMPVVCSKGGQVGLVDHMDGEHSIKLKKGDGATHHWIPLKWAAAVEGGKLKLNRTGEEAKRDWSSEGPKS